MKYDIEDYDTYGPILSLDVDLAVLKKHNITPDASYQQWLKYHVQDDTDLLDALTARYEDEEYDVAMASSWLL